MVSCIRFESIFFLMLIAPSFKQVYEYTLWVYLDRSDGAGVDIFRKIIIIIRSNPEYM